MFDIMDENESYVYEDLNPSKELKYQTNKPFLGNHDGNLYKNGSILNVPDVKNRLSDRHSMFPKTDADNSYNKFQKVLTNNDNSNEKQRQIEDRLWTLSGNEDIQNCTGTAGHLSNGSIKRPVNAFSKCSKSKRKSYIPKRVQKQEDMDYEEDLVEKEVKKYLLKIPDINSIIKNTVPESESNLNSYQEPVASSVENVEKKVEDNFVNNLQELEENVKSTWSEEITEKDEADVKPDLKTIKKKTTWKPKEKSVCEMCNKVFGRPSELRRHMVLHTGERNHKCEECDKVFTQRYHLIRHVKNVHKKEIENLVCGMCNETFNSEYLLLRHVKRHGVMTFACEVCRKEFKTKRQMTEHILSQHVGMKPFKCAQCDKVFSRKYHLERHVMIHTGVKEYQCEYCGKEFCTKGNLLAHVKRVHLKIKEFSCGVCQKGFFSPKDLQTHLKTHTGEKPYECEICHKKFTEKVNMEWHLRIHSGERPYQCDICQKSYTRMPHLIRHKREGLCRPTLRTELDEDFNADENMANDDVTEGIVMRHAIAAHYFYKWLNLSKTKSSGTVDTKMDGIDQPYTAEPVTIDNSTGNCENETD